MSESLEIRRVAPFAFRYPVTSPMRTSFGVVRDRPAVFIEIEDRSGAVSWAEVWCNFPNVEAKHRCDLVADVLRPLLKSRSFGSSNDVFNRISDPLRNSLP